MSLRLARSGFKKCLSQKQELKYDCTIYNLMWVFIDTMRSGPLNLPFVYFWRKFEQHRAII
uniref:Uncharacterized protein n=1 Tax=Anguilla anguilla TaxID=7936 RepID=A0A0E9XZK9_ANGAN